MGLGGQEEKEKEAESVTDTLQKVNLVFKGQTANRHII